MHGTVRVGSIGIGVETRARREVRTFSPNSAPLLAWPTVRASPPSANDLCTRSPRTPPSHARLRNLQSNIQFVENDKMYQIFENPELNKIKMTITRTKGHTLRMKCGGKEGRTTTLPVLYPRPDFLSLHTHLHSKLQGSVVRTHPEVHGSIQHHKQVLPFVALLENYLPLFERPAVHVSYQLHTVRKALRQDKAKPGAATHSRLSSQHRMLTSR